MGQAVNGDAFGRILDALIAENRRKKTEAAERASRRSATLWQMRQSEIQMPAGRPAKPSDFLDMLRDSEIDPTVVHHQTDIKAEPDALPEIREDDIRAELAISDKHDLTDLARIRKSFAVANHPDRNSGIRRHWAEERMKLANSIIDAEIALRRTAKKRRRFRT